MCNTHSLLTIRKPHLKNALRFLGKLTFSYLFFSGFAANALPVPLNATPTGILLDTEWKMKIYDYAQKYTTHSAWGINHAERDYQVSLQLAKQEGLSIDTDVIFAAAFLHDVGAIDPFRKKDIEHSARSIQISEPILNSFGFPMNKWPKVKAAILGHMYYADRPIENEAIVLHDADILDFLGIIGIARIISVTERHSWAPDLSQALSTLQQFKADLPTKIITSTAKKISSERVIEMDRFFATLGKETFNKTVL